MRRIAWSCLLALTAVAAGCTGRAAPGPAAPGPAPFYCDPNFWPF